MTDIRTEVISVNVKPEITLTSVVKEQSLTVNVGQSVVVEPSTSGVVIINMVAGQTLSGHRAVIAGDDGKAYYADSRNLDHISRVVGITTHASEADSNVTVLCFGKITEPSWNWDIGSAVYLGNNGVLTQVPPNSGFVLQLGFPINEKTLLLDIKVPIVLTL